MTCANLRSTTVVSQLGSRWMARALRAAVPVLFVAAAASAAASDALRDEGPGVISAQLDLEDTRRFEQGPFAFVVDPSTPARGTLALRYTVGVGSGISADRPIPVALQAAGLSNAFTVGYGLTSWLEPLAEITAVSSSGRTVTSGTLGVKLQLTEPRAPWRAAVLAGALREGASGAKGMWARAAGSWSAGPLVAELNGYVERVFAPGRDAIDYAVMAGASWRLQEWLRAGVEYVGQDLEEMVGGGAEGGARQAIGPNVALDLERGRYQLVAATLIGIGPRSPTALMRVGLLGTF